MAILGAQEFFLIFAFVWMPWLKSVPCQVRDLGKSRYADQMGAVADFQSGWLDGSTYASAHGAYTPYNLDTACVTLDLHSPFWEADS